ncbi:MAG TPA: PQQ-binding-like beta-propeller repeat protein [Candidatus Angelobacter sp.]|nr:PQQ-binding-like beta-propeller repeat protein [Candidatus Angelobacter sp.]
MNTDATRKMIALAILLLPVTMLGQLTPADGARLFTTHCAMCHDLNVPPFLNRDAFKTLAPEDVARALATGTMREQGAGLSEQQRKVIAEFITGKHFGGFSPAGDSQCKQPASATFSGPEWNGWGADLDNSRFQPQANLTAEQVKNLKLKWAFGFSTAMSAYAQPTVAGGRVFVGSAPGLVYSLDAATGCTYWSFQADTNVRTAVVVGPGNVVYFGDLRANVYALDAVTGKLRWKQTVDPHPVARVTGTPKLYQGRLYVPVSSHEEWASAQPNYRCCTFRGSVVALDAATGRQIWKSYTVAARPHPLPITKGAVQLWGPSGGGVWSSPTIDPKRKLLYIGTGDGYSPPATPLTDAIVALDLATGKVAWSRQVTPNDNWNISCFQPGHPNCPKGAGPDFDFGSSPILRTLSNGKSVVLAGQKSGVVYALDPDKKGEILWQVRLGKGGVVGGIQWGPAADNEAAYVALSDLGIITGPQGLQPDPKAGGGLFALEIRTGKKLWSALPNQSGCDTPGCSPAQSAAVTAIPGVVFSGSVDGHFRAYSSKDGTILWDFPTIRDFPTVNQVRAKGGSLDGAGAAVAGGMVFVNSGYGNSFGIPGNVLLAFGVE